MKLPSMNKVSPLEVILFVIFLLYLIFPIPTPAFLIPIINTNISLGIIIILTLYMLFYTTSILGVLTVFVAYELLRRSSNGLVQNTPTAQHVPVQPKKDKEMKEMNPPKQVSLEESIVNQMAPIGKGLNKGDGAFVESSFKPVSDKLDWGSMVN